MQSKLTGWGFLVAVLTAAVLIPVLQGDFLHWDDHNLYVENLYYRGWSPAHLQWMCSTFLLGHWQPLTWMSCALDYTLWGLNPAGWHGTNLLIHTVNAVLVYLLCLAFLKRDGGTRSVASTPEGCDEAQPSKIYIPAFLAALFWAIHPLRVEAAAWLATRGYLLCTTFCLLTVLFYLKETGTVRRPRGRCRGRACSPGAPLSGRLGEASLPNRYPFAALLCFTLATLTKGIGMMLPPVLLLIDWYEAKRMAHGAWREVWGRKLVEKIPFFMLSLLTGIMAFQAKRVAGGMASLEKYGLAERAGQAVYGIWFYLLKTVAPAQLSPVYSERPASGPVMVSLVLTATVCIFLFLFRRRLFPRSAGSGRAIIGTLGAFLLLIFPMLGITQSGIQIVADRFTYFPAVSFSVLLAAGLARLPAMRRTVFGALAVLLTVLGVQTVIWAGVWADSLLFWNQSVVSNGEDARAYTGMAQALMDRGAYRKAIDYLDKALRLDPQYASALQNRVVARIHTGEYLAALDDATAALALDGLRPEDGLKMLIGHGQAAEAVGQTDVAFEDYSIITENEKLDPVWRMRALQLRARLFLSQGNLTGAKKDLDKILTLPDPSRDYWRRARKVLEEIKKIPEE